MTVETARHTVQTARSCTDITAFAVLSVRGEDLADRDAGPLRAGSRDEEDGTTLVDDAVAARHPGSWLGFRAVDFGSGADRVRAVASAPAGGAQVEVRLDEPLTGALTATLQVPATGDPQIWAQVDAPLIDATGVHDVYFVFGTSGARLNTAAFGR
jgi:beta-glucosidase